MNKKIYSSLIVLVIALVAGYAHYRGSIQGQITPSPVLYNNQTSTNQTPTLPTESTLTKINTRLSFPDNLIALPVFQMVLVSGESNSSSYRWKNLQFILQPNDSLGVMRDGAKLADVYATHAPITFGNQQKQYFLFEGDNCGNKHCLYVFSLYRLDQDGTFARVNPPSDRWILMTDHIPNVDGVIVSSSNLYLIFGYGDSHDAIVLDLSGRYKTKVTGTYRQRVMPSGVVPAAIEQYLRASR